MSKYEERAFPLGKTKPDLAGLKCQLARLKEDLGRFMSRNPAGAVVASLRERIRELETQIAEADRARLKERQAGREAGGEPGDAAEGVHSTAGRFPPRRR